CHIRVRRRTRNAPTRRTILESGYPSRTVTVAPHRGRPTEQSPPGREGLKEGNEPLPGCWLCDHVRRFSLEVIQDILDGKLGTGLQYLWRHARGMRSENNIGKSSQRMALRQRFGLEHVQPCPGNPAGRKGLDQRPLVDGGAG